MNEDQKKEGVDVEVNHTTSEEPNVQDIPVQTDPDGFAANWTQIWEQERMEANERIRKAVYDNILIDHDSGGWEQLQEDLDTVADPGPYGVMMKRYQELKARYHSLKIRAFSAMYGTFIPAKEDTVTGRVTTVPNFQEVPKTEPTARPVVKKPETAEPSPYARLFQILGELTPQDATEAILKAMAHYDAYFVGSLLTGGVLDALSDFGQDEDTQEKRRVAHQRISRFIDYYAPSVDHKNTRMADLGLIYSTFPDPRIIKAKRMNRKAKEARMKREAVEKLHEVTEALEAAGFNVTTVPDQICEETGKPCVGPDCPLWDGGGS